MKRSIYIAVVVCILNIASVANAGCKVVWVMDAIDRPGRLVTVCTPEENTQTPAPEPSSQNNVMQNVLQNAFQNRNTNPYGGVGDAFNQGFRRGLGR